ncbi:MAG: GFA family protein [Oceanicaulis sp.]
MTERHEGRCHCGAVRYAGLGAIETHVCHCTDCLGWVGGPFIAAMFDDGVDLQTPEAVRWYESSEVASRGSCAACSTALFYKGNGRGISSVSAGTLVDQISPPTIGEHIFIDQKPEYYDFAGDAPRLTRAQLLAEIEAENGE